MVKFRSKKDGSHYPVKGGKAVYPKGTVVNRSGYRGVVTDVRNKEQREVRLDSGKAIVDTHDLKYWKVEDTPAYQKLASVKRDDLDPLEQIWYDQGRKSSSHEHAMQIIINTVEGDYSQLSSKLEKIAGEEDKEMGAKQ